MVETRAAASVVMLDPTGHLPLVRTSMASRTPPISSLRPGSVARILASPDVTDATRKVLQDRFEERETASPRCFTLEEFETARAACARLIPQVGRDHPVPLATLLDAGLANGDGDGWRYDAMPPDQDAMRQGFAALDSLAQRRTARRFSALTASEQDALLGSVQRASAEGWDGPPPDRFFQELLARLVEIYYARPAAIEEIGYIGFADAAGFSAIGLDQRDRVEDETAA